MKKILFNQFVDRVITTLSLKDPTILFHRSKRQDLVDARHLIFYLCSERNMSVADIKRLMGERGLPLQYPALVGGIAKIKIKIKSDTDYQFLVNKIQKSVGFELEEKI
jgi:hypothetical protein